MKAKNEKILKQLIISKRGITLVALVVTTIVLLILAGVAISLSMGKDGIFKRVDNATEEYNKATVKEELALIIGEYPLTQVTGETDSLENFLLSKGTDSVIDKGDGTVEVEYKDYLFVVNKETEEIIQASKLEGVKPEIEVSKTLSSDEKKVTIKIEVTNEVESVDEIKLINSKGEEIAGTVNGKIGTYEVNLNGKYRVKLKATTDEVQRKSTKEVEVNEILVEFNTRYGRIEVVWLDTSNNIIDKPNSPAGYLKGMTPVKWNGTEEALTTSTDLNWYSYNKIEGTGDNLTSHWANAKNTINRIDSYFVWIPRYAYRITYYSSDSNTEPTGYYDGKGMYRADGELKYVLDDGIETVEKNGTSYIVHPAFMDDTKSTFSHGGWDEDLAGIWVGKYEASRSNATNENEGNSSKLKVVPNVISWRGMNIGDYYTKSLNYDENKQSHLMKNSEWGAVAYLTHSQYGRNGHEIDINNSDSYITGNGGGSTNASYTSGTTYAYDTDEGQKASSTGNIYGIYDLSGGAWEYIAAFNSADKNNYEATYGSSFAGTDKSNTKFATKYINNTTTYYGSKIYEIGKIGDSTKEVWAYGATSWFSDISQLCGDGSSPFVWRGGYNRNNIKAGVFTCGGYVGYVNFGCSFRPVLV